MEAHTSILLVSPWEIAIYPHIRNLSRKICAHSIQWISNVYQGRILYLYHWINGGKKVCIIELILVKPNLSDDFQSYISLIEDATAFLRDQTRDFDIAFCHNDLLAPNVILNTEEGAIPIRFIDFEYACYNYIGFDIANHFCEYQGYEFDFSKYPSKEMQIQFIQHYLKSTNPDLVEKLHHQVVICGLVSIFDSYF